MKRGLAGTYSIRRAGGEEVRAFVPHPLPPRPPLAVATDLQDLLDRALVALGRLDSVAALLPDTSLFLYTYVRKEAVLSSQIEGTQSSLSDLLLYELDQAPGVPMNDVIEVSTCVQAQQHGLKRVRSGFPLSGRLLREVHEKLLSHGRGSDKAPGEFRRSQNWIGGSRPGNAHFVPPPHEKLADCMADLERFLNDVPARTPTLVKAALAHVQFESIHPFLDGNGRVGRVLVSLILSAEGVLREPLLYLSLFLKQHRKRYYELLDVVRSEGDWEKWLRFFAEGVATTAQGAVDTAQSLAKLFRVDRKRIESMGRIAGSALRVHHELQRRILDTVPSLVEETGLTAPTVNAALSAMVKAGILNEVTGRRRNRVFAYKRYLKLMNEGTEPLAKNG